MSEPEKSLGGEDCARLLELQETSPVATASATLLNPSPVPATLSAIARFHQVVADLAKLAHQSSACIARQMHAAQHLGLKTRFFRITPEQLARTLLSALVRVNWPNAIGRALILAQSNVQHIFFLLQDPGAPKKAAPADPWTSWTADERTRCC